MAKPERWELHAEIGGIALPYDLERACRCMANGPQWKAFLDERFGAGKWTIAEALREWHRAEGKTVAIDRDQLGALAVEHGYQRLKDEIAHIEAPRRAADPCPETLGVEQ